MNDACIVKFSSELLGSIGSKNIEFLSLFHIIKLVEFTFKFDNFGDEGGIGVNVVVKEALVIVIISEVPDRRYVVKLEVAPTFNPFEGAYGLGNKF